MLGVNTNRLMLSRLSGVENIKKLATIVQSVEANSLMKIRLSWYYFTYEPRGNGALLSYL